MSKKPFGGGEMTSISSQVSKLVSVIKAADTFPGGACRSLHTCIAMYMYLAIWIK